MLVYICIILIIVYKIKFFKLNEYNQNSLSLENSNSVKGLAAIAVVLHHIVQRLHNPQSLVLFLHIGYLSVSIFFFYSGYGLMRSYITKKNYLNNFWTIRISKVVIPFILSNILFIIRDIVCRGTKFSLYDILTYTLGIRLIDGFKWYIIALIILYSGFYFVFKYLDTKKAIVGIFLLITCFNLACRLIGTGIWWYNSTYCFFIGIIFGAYCEPLFNVLRKKHIIITLSTISIFITTFILNISKGNIVTAIVSSSFFVLVCICLLMKIQLYNNVLNFLGSISYEIYLIHKIPLDAFDKIRNGHAFIYLTLCIITSILMAYAFNLLSKHTIKIYTTYLYKCKNRYL